MSGHKRLNEADEDPGIPLVDRSRNSPTKAYTGRTFGPVHIPVSGRSFSARLKRRKKLLYRRKIIVNMEFFLGMTGFVLMLILIEVHIQEISFFSADTILTMQVLISVSTGLLLCAVFMYHITTVKLMMTDKNVFDYRMVLSYSFVIKVCFELLVCSMHPLPGNLTLPFVTIHGYHGQVTVEAVLSILMLLRLYIVLKFIIINSQWMLSTSMQSIGNLTKVDIDAGFIMKCLMVDHPVLLVLTIMLGIFIVNSWAMRTCESYYVPDNEQSGFFGSMWLVAITFLTVGYGDLSPNSHCGRFIATVTGLMGVAITALLVTVITSKFQQSRSERSLHTFMAQMELQKRRRTVAANIIKLSMGVWLLKCHDRLTPHQDLLFHIKLSRVVKQMRTINANLSNIIENSIDIVDVAATAMNVSDMLMKLQFKVEDSEFSERTLESRVRSINSKLNAIQTSVR
ncbi:small conductance calcium-activated potassium channel protein 2-like [Gigantopelta aegis]|uniref:small conductance calcium-activated potassium channel protein 2-like n=1 Tax=Gigantopelta aegis TaxID=1735272 RepID=UPI001B88CE7D|nr:small conductance calcium-activated potassium channel protein 2-like [Gigantopelta aegis]